MKIRRAYTTIDGVRYGYYQYGEKGKKYYYTPGNEESRERAKEKAEFSKKRIKKQVGGKIE